MSILDKLLQTPAEAFEERETKEYKSKNLKRRLKSKEDVVITLQEIPAGKCRRIINSQYGKDGQIDPQRTHEAQLRTLVEGVMEPNLKDQKLQQHFGADTGTILAEKLFGLEVTAISDEILRLSGFVTGDEEEENAIDEEIKND